MIASAPGFTRSEPAPLELSVVLVVQNEARHLSELLPQLLWADEVVVVDGGSSDATAATALAQGARLLFRPFDNFAAQRNFAVSQARGRWVLSLDADERPTPALVEELRRVIAAGQYTAYRVPIRSTVFGRPFRFCGTQDDRPVRLACRDQVRWTGAVHEAMALPQRGAAAGLGRLNAALEHDPFPDLMAFLAKMHRYTAIAAAARVAAGRAPRASDRWWLPPREVFRRLIWKHGWLDGPQGWLFCLLSGLSEWVLAQRHARYWSERRSTSHAQPGAQLAWARWQGRDASGRRRRLARWLGLEPEAGAVEVLAVGSDLQPSTAPGPAQTLPLRRAS